MNTQKNVSLAQFTSFATGGLAENLITYTNAEELQNILKPPVTEPLWVLGYGTNVLISDYGLPGTTLLIKTGSAKITEDNILIATAGMWWDDVVTLALQHNLWGIELMSGIPSSVGGAISGNIAAYGQQVSDCLDWIEVYDYKSAAARKLTADEIDFSYRASSLQNHPELVITKAAFKLSRQPTTDNSYASAIIIAQELKLKSDTIENRRQIILEARLRAGSLYNPNDPDRSHTAGSFFKNPKTDLETAKYIASFDETGKSLERILAQNKIHGGDQTRVSAAHVLLAAGFRRGQVWGSIRLHPHHVLKLENTGGATSQQIYNVAMEIIATVREKLGITLESEVKYLGDFSVLQ